MGYEPMAIPFVPTLILLNIMKKESGCLQQTAALAYYMLRKELFFILLFVFQFSFDIS